MRGIKSDYYQLLLQVMDVLEATGHVDKSSWHKHYEIRLA